jgi:hypothetical protein
MYTHRHRVTYYPHAENLSTHTNPFSFSREDKMKGIMKKADTLKRAKAAALAGVCVCVCVFVCEQP